MTARLLDEQVLPDERGQVERRHEHDEAPPALELDERRRCRRSAAGSRRRRGGPGWSAAAPSCRITPVEEAAGGDLARRAARPDGVRRSRARRARRRPSRRSAASELRPRAAHRDEDGRDQRDVEEHARDVRRRGRVEHLVRRDDHDRADDHPGEAPGAAEDHDRVDRDQHRVPKFCGKAPVCDGGEDRSRRGPRSRRRS